MFGQKPPDSPRRPARIIAINRFYRPDHSATSQMLTDLAEYLAQNGLPVTVITSRLIYDSPDMCLEKAETINGVEVRRVWTSRFGRKNLVLRMIDYATFYLTSFGAVLKNAQAGDVVIAKTDPPLLGVTIGVAARLKGAKLVNWCQDLFPETASALGVKVVSGPIRKALIALRNRSLRAASFNAVLNDAMADRLVAFGVDREKIAILPNWCDRRIQPVSHKDNPYREKWGLSGSRVIAYSGNLGRAHMPDKIADLVRATLDVPDVTWVFIGGGAGLRKIEALKQETGAENLLIKPYQPVDELSRSLSVADVHLISLEPKCEGLIAPSKLYGIEAVRRPALFLGDVRGATAQEVSSACPALLLDYTQTPENWRANLCDALETLCANEETVLSDRFATEVTGKKLANWREKLNNTLKG